ncbi:hypothetical protein [Sphingobium nicotianae]|uniref:Uncharacterized protein n=1 Tax=Sphingobium nicotianae TaxID=2782607 RepID=A0A9X1DBL8_9SPHN|nr:hypothetical protein [Sphingobium nicotianae]MBT2187060.1 hypothetical protein [Sphingobium nicotianae]
MATDDPKTVIVERSGGNGLTAVLVILIVALIAVGAYFLISKETNKNDAISHAAQQVGDAAQQAGDAAQEAAKKQ